MAERKIDPQPRIDPEPRIDRGEDVSTRHEPIPASDTIRRQDQRPQEPDAEQGRPPRNRGDLQRKDVPIAGRTASRG